MRFRNMLKGSKPSDPDHDRDHDDHNNSFPSSPPLPSPQNNPSSPEFTFIRTDSMNQEIVTLSDAPSSPPPYNHSHLSPPQGGGKPRRSMDAIFGSRSRSRTSSVSSQASSTGERRRLSQRLHLSRKPEASENVPFDMPAIEPGAAEAQWEKRATMLAGQNGLQRTRSRSVIEEDEPVPQIPPVESMGSLRLDSRAASPSPAASLAERRSPVTVSSKQIDADIQEAVRLHEDSDYEKSTKLFEKLADSQGANNALSQVLYGLALRHGWGIEADPERAVQYLTAAASNAASIEQLALQAGMAKGGAAKGELVLAIFELANCFRHGWGIAIDPVAAKQYYETAANLGDTDAMNEVAWCYLDGFGCKKDKYLSAKYYRRAEGLGVKLIGNTWIWKPKYDNPPKSKK